MSKLLFIRSEDRIEFIDDAGVVTGYECRSDFFPTSNGGTEKHERLPDGFYTVTAELPPVDNGPGYGTFYIETGDPRERDIHGGGSNLDDPYAPRQGWLPTYGCLRMQNEDGQALSLLLIDAGNSVEFEVRDER